MKVINVNSMVGEDFRSQALLNMQKYLEMKLFSEEAEARIRVLEKELKYERDRGATLVDQLHWKNMENEDHHAQI